MVSHSVSAGTPYFGPDPGCKAMSAVVSDRRRRTHLCAR